METEERKNKDMKPKESPLRRDKPRNKKDSDQRHLQQTPLKHMRTADECRAEVQGERAEDDGWAELAAKIQRRSPESDARQEEVSMEKMDIMEIMCDETNFVMFHLIEQEVSEYKDASLEEDYDWDNHQRPSWADLTEEEYKTRIFDDLTGAELKYEKVLEPRLGEIEAHRM